MENVCSRGKPWNVYGSADDKLVFVYGMLDPGATSFQRGEIGFGFTIAGFLLTFFLPRLSREAMAAMHQRIRDGLTTTFASHYTAGVWLEQLLERETIAAIMAKRTGEKYLVLPNG